MKHRQPGLFDIEERTAKLTKMGDPLVELKARIDWEAFRPELNRVHEKARKSDAGAKPIDVIQAEVARLSFLFYIDLTNPIY